MTFFLAGLVASACATDPEPRTCAAEYSRSICLDLGQAGMLVAQQPIIEEEVARTLNAVQPLLNLSALRISLIADARQVIPEIGMGGFNPSRDEVRLYADPALPDIATVLRTHLLPQLAHEMHHAARRRAIGYGSTLLQAVVSEGLADHFALEVSGIAPPPWTVALTPAQLALWIPEATSRSTGAYNHAEWFFGTTPTIPRWTGYSVGFEVVRAYLAKDPSRRASALVGTPASAFVPYTP